MPLIWHTDAVKRLRSKWGHKLAMTVFPQCALGAEVQKYTALLGSAAAIKVVTAMHLQCTHKPRQLVQARWRSGRGSGGASPASAGRATLAATREPPPGGAAPATGGQ